MDFILGNIISHIMHDSYLIKFCYYILIMNKTRAKSNRRLHIARGLYYGSYKSPRVLLWTIGVIILVIPLSCQVKIKF